MHNEQYLLMYFVDMITSKLSKKLSRMLSRKQIFSKNKKTLLAKTATRLEFIGRNDRIWTYDPLSPRQVRYQAALRPDDLWMLIMKV